MLKYRGDGRESTHCWPPLVFSDGRDWSITYFSAASRTTQAIETFFSFARFSRVRYSLGGKVMDARGWRNGLDFSLFSLFSLTECLFTVVHHVTPSRCM